MLFKVCTGLIDFKCWVIVIIVCIIACLCACLCLGLLICLCVHDYENKHRNYTFRRDTLQASMQKTV